MEVLRGGGGEDDVHVHINRPVAEVVGVVGQLKLLFSIRYPDSSKQWAYLQHPLKPGRRMLGARAVKADHNVSSN